MTSAGVPNTKRSERFNHECNKNAAVVGAGKASKLAFRVLFDGMKLRLCPA